MKPLKIAVIGVDPISSEILRNALIEAGHIGIEVIELKDALIGRTQDVFKVSHEGDDLLCVKHIPEDLHFHNFISKNAELLKTNTANIFDKLSMDEYLEEEKPPNKGARRAVYDRATSEQRLKERWLKKAKNRKKRRK